MDKQTTSLALVAGAVILAVAFGIVTTMSRSNVAAPSTGTQRIVSLAPSVTESLFILGVGDRVVGVTEFCKYPPEAAKREKIGNLLQPNIEKISTLRPDMIIGSAEGNRPRPLQRLEELGFRLVLLERCDDFDGICSRFEELGRIVDRAAEAETVVAEARRAVAGIVGKVKGARKPKVFWQVGAEPLVTVAKGSFVDDMISLGGGQNIAHDLPRPYIRYSKEEVIKQDPDVIVIATMGQSADEQKKAWQRFGHLSVVKNDRFLIIDPHWTCQPVPTSFVEGLKRVAAFLHPEAFAE